MKMVDEILGVVMGTQVCETCLSNISQQDRLFGISVILLCKANRMLLLSCKSSESPASFSMAKVRFRDTHLDGMG
jgi:hypothetical protein